MIRPRLLILFPLFIGACATPVPPSGGPVDRTPPDVISMDPPSNSVDFKGDRIIFEFSERVDRATFARALTIVPELASPPELDWSGRRLEMKFMGPLPDATTFVFTIDNTLRDEHNVSLKEPIVRALATGPTIDDGVIAGRLSDPRTGRSISGLDVVAIRVDTTGDNASAPTSYRTQTGPEGTFSLEFLPDAPFFVYAFEDRNRNRSIDPGEQFAVPPRPEFVPASSDSLPAPFDWWAVNPDTTAPSILGVRARSSRRVEVRYSEPVRFDTLDPSGWAAHDTLTGQIANVAGVYLSPTDNRRIILLTDSLASSGYRLEVMATVRDTAGNAAVPAAPLFAATAEPDTTRLRFLRFDPESSVSPTRVTLRQKPGVQFNQYVPATVVRRIVAVTDTAGVPRRFDPVTNDGVTWSLWLTPPIRPGEIVRVEIDSRVAAIDTVRAMAFRALSSEEMGAFSGYVESTDSVIVEVYQEEGRGRSLETVRRTSGAFHVDGLEVGSYRIRMIEDRDRDGEWDWGRITPYEMPERLLWYPDSARARAGWETVLDTVRFENSGLR